MPSQKNKHSKRKREDEEDDEEIEDDEEEEIHDHTQLDEDNEDSEMDHKKRRKKRHDKATEHKDTLERAKELKEGSEDAGARPHFKEATDEILNLQLEAAELIGFDAILAYVHAIKYRNSVLKGPVKGQEYNLSGNLIDSWIEYINVMLEDRKKLDDLLHQMVTIRETVYGKKKGIIGKVVGKTTDVVDKTSRTLTRNTIKLKRRKELGK